MTPKDLSSELRKIASAIDYSKNPSRGKVLRDLNRIVASMSRRASAQLTIKDVAYNGVDGTVYITAEGILAGQSFVAGSQNGPLIFWFDWPEIVDTMKFDGAVPQIMSDAVGDFDPRSPNSVEFLEWLDGQLVVLQQKGIIPPIDQI